MSSAPRVDSLQRKTVISDIFLHDTAAVDDNAICYAFVDICLFTIMYGNLFCRNLTTLKGEVLPYLVKKQFSRISHARSQADDKDSAIINVKQDGQLGKMQMMMIVGWWWWLWWVW